MGVYIVKRDLSLYAVWTLITILFILIVHAPAIINGATYVASLGTWVVSGLFEANWNFSIDALTYVMLLVVFHAFY